MLTDEERKKIYEEEKARLEAENDKDDPRNLLFPEEKARLEAQEGLKRKPKTMSKSTSIGCLILIGLAVLLIVICQLLPKEKTGGTASPSSAPTSDGPALEVVSFRWGGTAGGGYVKAEGQVKNISDKSLRNVTAVVTFSDKSGGFITSSDAMIDYNPILPGQTSPFSVIETDNPAMHTGTAEVEFKFLMGGTIPTRHSE